jgi:hypothetical protein
MRGHCDEQCRARALTINKNSHRSMARYLQLAWGLFLKETRMLKTLVNSTVLAAAVVLPMSFAACERPANETATNPPAGAGERTGRAVDNAANNAANNARDAANRTANSANNAANNTNTGSTAGPGLPSVQGTDTGNMTTPDAAAQRLIDNARNNLRDRDINKAKALLAELKDKGMYDKLSATQRTNVDQLERDINAAGSGTAQENR